MIVVHWSFGWTDLLFVPMIWFISLLIGGALGAVVFAIGRRPLRWAERRIATSGHKGFLIYDEIPQLRALYGTLLGLAALGGLAYSTTVALLNNANLRDLHWGCPSGC